MANPISCSYKAGMHSLKALLAAFVAFLFPLGALAAEDGMVGGVRPWQLGFQHPATPVMEKLFELHHYLVILIVIISVFVAGLLVYVCFRFSAKRNPVPSKTSHNTLIEILWTVIPIFILIAIAIPSLRTFYYMVDNIKPDMTLKVTGYQWYWGYEYADYDVSYQSNIKPEKDLDPAKGDIRMLSVDKPLVVPVGAKVRVLVTGSDVIHSFAMPSFGIKTDAVPGRINNTWFQVEKPGVYYGQCSELCGINHGFMPIEIHAVEKPVFDQWIVRAKAGDYSINGTELPVAEAVPVPAKPATNGESSTTKAKN